MKKINIVLVLLIVVGIVIHFIPDNNHKPKITEDEVIVETPNIDSAILVGEMEGERVNAIIVRQNFIVDSINTILAERFDYVYPRFKSFNRNIDSATVRKFCAIMNYYKLDSTKRSIEMYTGQILLESGAKQCKTNGALVISPAGAMGMCQIMPRTALGYFQKYIGDEDRFRMSMMGVTDFSFAYDESIPYDTKRQLTKEWLSDETNNLVMWGYISHKSLIKTGDVIKQLISYNAGPAGAEVFLKNNEPSAHSYIKGINSKLGVAEDLIN
jgi:hypothetical protein